MRSTLRLRNMLCGAGLVWLAGLAGIANAAQSAPSGAFAGEPAPTRRLSLKLDQGTWMMPSLSPDGRTIVFDLLGDIYAVDANGGHARPLLAGRAFDNQPVYSPDGKHIAFISDRSGANNLWVMDAEGGALAQLSHVTGETIFGSPAWSADGRQVYVSHTSFAVLGLELWRYDLAGGEGTRITTSAPNHEAHDARHNALGATASPDGKYLYYTDRTGTTFTRKNVAWSLVRRDLATGVEETIMDPVGGVMRPAFSPDGSKLVYASRDAGKTGLRLRDFAAGTDRWLVLPVDHDSTEGGQYLDVMPRITFAPDGRSVVTSVGGKLVRVALDGKVTDIPFTADAELDVGRLTRVSQHDQSGPVHPRILQGPQVSPDGRTVAFSMLGRIYTMPLAPGATPSLLKTGDLPAFHPAWSPDGRRLAYVTWTAKAAGAVWIAGADGGSPRRLTQAPAFYTDPVFARDGAALFALRSEQYDRLHILIDDPRERAADIVRIPLSGGEPALVAHAKGARGLHFANDPARLMVYTPEGLSSVAPDGGELRRELVVKTKSANQYVGAPTPVDEVRLSPAGGFALAHAANQLWLLKTPPRGGEAAPELNLTRPGDVVARITRVGADYFAWADGGQTIVWSAGATLHRLSLKAAVASVDGGAEAQATAFAATVELPRDTPRGALLLHGATVVTMRTPDEVIRNADVLVTDNRIVAVGAAGSIPVPAGAQVRDVTGKFIIPGFVDTHAHWFEDKRDVLDFAAWPLSANLAYGVTSGLDPQSFTPDVFAYKDAIDAGLMLGPRAWSTGPGVFYDTDIHSVADATAVLSRYRDDYGTHNIKSYMMGDRQQRSYLLAASRALGMMPTTEGASNLEMNLTHALDGYSGNEHNLPVSPLHQDVIQLFAKTRTSYTPTLLVMYGGQPALDDMMARHPEDFDAKLRRFVPADSIEEHTRNLEWVRAEDRRYPEFARDALAIQRAGGVVGIGSHGMVQGIAYHWELEAFASGGATPLEALHAATIGSAEVIGHGSEVGSLEPGKFADLLILDRDPLADLHNTRYIDQVMKNGRLYQASTLDEVWPRQRVNPSEWFAGDDPLSRP